MIFDSKTQIALDFAHLALQTLEVYWVRAESYSTFVQDFGRIAEALSSVPVKVADWTEPEHRTTQLLEATAPNWLLILDNADDFDQFVGDTASGKSIYQCLPKKGSILITTRDSRFSGTVASAKNNIHVQAMSHEEARTLLANSLPFDLSTGGEEVAANVLLEELGNIPLAIAQAAANIRELQLTVTNYVKAYRAKRDQMALLRQPVIDLETKDPRTKVQSVLVTWEMSFTYLREKFPRSASCLAYMGFFHWRVIPQKLLMALPEFQDLGELGFREDLKHLLHLSLVEEVSEFKGFSVFSIPQIVHERIYHRLNAQDKAEFLEAVVKVLNAYYPVSPEIERKRGSRTWLYLLPHVIHLASKMEESEFARESGIFLLLRARRFLSHSYRTRLAASFSNLALQIALKCWDHDDRTTLAIRHIKTACLIEDAQYANAERECELALDMLRLEGIKTSSTQQQLLAIRKSLLNRLALAARAQNKFVRAEDLYRQILSMAAKPDTTPANLILIQLYIGHCLVDQNRLEEAEQLCEQILGTAQANKMDLDGKRENRKVYMSILSLKAGILAKMALPSEEGRTKKMAEVTLIRTKVMDAMLHDWGLGHLDTWITLNIFLGTLLEQGDVESAESTATQFLSTAKESDIRFEGRFLDIFLRTAYHVLSLLAVSYSKRVHDQQSTAQSLQTTFLEFISSRGVYHVDAVALTNPITRTGWEISFRMWEQLHIFISEAAVYLVESVPENLALRFNWAKLLRRLGHSLEAERLCKKILQLQESEVSLGPDNYKGLHYVLMLAIMDQEGREKDVSNFREANLETLKWHEEKHGDLQARLKKVHEEWEVYNEAQGRALAGELTFRDSWWLAHEETLDHTEFLFGPIKLD
jgi:tetratricopeptide (TPR) repeat protein